MVSAYSRWLLACAALIAKRIGVFFCLPILAAVSWFFTATGERGASYQVEAANYFWTKLPPRPRIRPKRREKTRSLRGEVLPPANSGKNTRLP